MRKFFRILGEHKLRISIGTVIIILIVFLAYIRTAVGDLVAHNASNASMIGIEMLCESGPNFKLAAERHISRLKKYTAHMEKKYLSTFLGIFYEEYTPTKGFEEALKTLEEAEDSNQGEYARAIQEKYARAIWLAGEQIERYRMKAASFPKLKTSLHKYQEVPDELVRDVGTALGESQKSFERFKENPTLENTVFLCEDDRWTALLLFMARAGYNSSHEELFDEFCAFHELEKDVTAEEQKLFEKLSSDNDPQMRMRGRFIGHILRSELRRLDVLEALKIPDMPKARTLMWETIEIAYHEREVILEFTAAVAYGKGKQWERPRSSEGHTHAPELLDDYSEL